MDTTSVIIIAIFALIAVAGFLVFRKRGKVEVKGPLGIELKLDASNEQSAPSPAVKIDGAKSKAGGLAAEDNTGRGVDVKNIEVKDDIFVSSTPPKNDTQTR